jgi:hypothetical protein
LLRRGGKWALVAAAVVFALPAWAQRANTIFPEPNALDSLPSSISIAPPAHPELSLSTIRIPENLPDKPREPIGVERLPSRRSWMILSAVQHGAATFDAYSTRQAIENGAVERDPLMRPFAGSPAIYAAIQVAPLVLDYTARKMQLSRYDTVRKLWWVPQTTSTALFLASGMNNMHNANRK